MLSEPALGGNSCALPTVSAVRDLVDARGPLNEDDQPYLLDLGERARGKARVTAP